ncbi:ABC transporter ATP-binding protein [Lacticaseibacillus sp. 53-4]|uniref:ATP-binding cassette domain-containing protein n=1 Tax=Lacticaseibacillus sp. 53-4 TaxID=2799575 RepID=UPI0019424938|nr:ABC transporter ATP-binding protein [Lacticaseibacillus sp. 53-4]
MIKALFRKRPLLVVMFVVFTMIHATVTVSYAWVIQVLSEVAQGNLKISFTLVVAFAASFSIVTALVNFLGGYLKGRVINTSVSILRDSTFQTFLGENLSKYTNHENNSRIAMLTSTVDIVQESYIKSALDMYSLALQFIFSICYALVINVQLTFFVLILEIPAVLLPVLVRGPLRRVKTPVLKNLGLYTDKITNWLNGISTIKNLGREKIFAGLHTESLNTLLKSENSDLLVKKIVSSISQFLGDVVYLGTWVIGGYLIIHNRLTFSAFLAFTQLAVSISFPIESLSNIIPEFLGGIRAYDEYRGMLNTAGVGLSGETDEPTEGAIGIDAPGVKNAISYQNVSVLNAGKVLLNHVNLAVPKNDRTIIVGESGAGKSTLVNVLFGYQAEVKGKISIFGSHDPDFVRLAHKYIGFQEQHTYIFNGTIRENVTMFSHDFSEDEIQKTLIDVGLANAKAEASELLNQDVSTNGTLLSGGERQRIGLARNLIMKKQFYIFDELSSGLDRRSAADLEDLLFELNIGFMYITHNYSRRLLERADDIIRVTDGNVSTNVAIDDLG